MKKGESVKVKQGVVSPDFEELEIGGWQGRILDFNREENLILIAFDSITIESLPDFYIQKNIDEGYDFAEIWLYQDEVEPTKSRDFLEDVKNAVEYVYSKFIDDGIEQRIQDILQNKNLDRNDKNQEKFLYYLNKNLNKPILLTGMDDFEWEEPYVMGVFSQKEYKELKKTRPSYTDKFEFIKMSDSWDDLRGLFAEVRRVSDNKKFELPLWDLKTVDIKDENHIAITTYSYWMSNY